MKPKKSLGQNFLKDNTILSKIVDSGEISKHDTVIEIGPGTGNLTKELIKKNPKNLLVVEKDEGLSNLLFEKYGNKITIINKDILKVFKNFRFDEPIKVFGNLPYNISTKILISFIKLDDLNAMCNKFVFIFQKEVAERIVAKQNTKDYGRLSILTSWKMHSKKIFDISPINFYPKPKVWSSLIALTPKTKIEELNISHVQTLKEKFFQILI